MFYLAYQLKKTVGELKDIIDSEELEGWKCWFKSYQRGGARSPDTEINDLLIARVLTYLVNSNRINGRYEVREMMVFPPPLTQQDIDNRIEAAKLTMRAYMSAIKRQKPVVVAPKVEPKRQRKQRKKSNG